MRLFVIISTHDTCCRKKLLTIYALCDIGMARILYRELKEGARVTIYNRALNGLNVQPSFYYLE